MTVELQTGAVAAPGRVRLRDWQSRLDACIRERRALPFAWGSQDCALFAADCVEAVTGVDPAADARGTYSDTKGAARMLKKRGGVEALADEYLGERIAPLMVAAGDVGVIDQEGGPMLAVCVGSHWLAPGVDGLVSLPIEAARVAWRVC